MKDNPVPAQTPLIDPALLSLLEEKLGHRIPERRFRQLGEAVAALAVASGYTNMLEYLTLARTLPVDSPLVQSLVHAVTNKESYFFRDAATMQSLREEILPQVIERCSSSRTLRIWSAGCSTGEELYSIAILLQELIHDYDKWTICLLGTDIDEGAVRKARKGQYKRWSLRTTEEPERLRYFHHNPEDESYLLKALYQKNVAFGLHNLADGNLNAPSPGTFDLIFCRNVLIYFGDAAQKVVHRKFHNALAPGGLWIGGSSDPTPRAEWTTRVFPGVLAHTPEAHGLKKNVSSSRPSPARVTTPLPPAIPAAEQLPRGDHKYQPSRAVTSALSRGLDVSRAPFTPPLEKPIAPVFQAISPVSDQRSHFGQSPVASGAITPTEEKLEEASRLANRGALLEALGVLRRIVQDAPLTAEAYLLLAQVQQSLGHPEAAVHELKRAVYLEPSNAAAHLRLGFLLAEQGGTAAAIRAFRAATSLVSGIESPEPEDVEIRRTAAAQLVRLMREENG